MSDLYVARLVRYGLESGLIPEEERIYSTNQILEVMKKDDYEAPTAEEVGKHTPSLCVAVSLSHPVRSVRHKHLWYSEFFKFLCRPFKPCQKLCLLLQCHFFKNFSHFISPLRSHVAIQITTPKNAVTFF